MQRSSFYFVIIGIIVSLLWFQFHCKIYTWGRRSRVQWCSTSKLFPGIPCQRRCWKLIINATHHHLLINLTFIGISFLFLLPHWSQVINEQRILLNFARERGDLIYATNEEIIIMSLIKKILCQLQGRRQGRTKILYRSELFLRSLESGDAQGYGKEITRSGEKGKENWFLLFVL